jgi:predicted dehydrogenase
MSKQKLNVGVIGYGFMGRTHANAFRQVSQYFDLPLQPVLKAVCGRDVAKTESFARNWGYDSWETDWRKLIARPDIDLTSPARMTPMPRSPSRRLRPARW